MTTNYHERNHWVGTAAEMALCTPTNPGAIWFQTDTGDVYWWDGANWLAMGGGGIGPPTEGPGIDIIGTQVGIGGDTVLLYDHGGLPVAEFATITLAMAAASAGQLVQTPPGTFTEDFTIPAGVGLASIGNNTIVAGTITLGGASSYTKGITVSLVGNSGGTLVGVIGPAAGIAAINDCSIVVTNNGAGDAYGVQVNDGELLDYCSHIQGISIGGSGYGVYWAGSGHVSINSGSVYGSTLDFAGFGSIPTGWYFPADFDGWVAYEWASAGGAFSTQSWNAAHGYSALGCIYADTEPAPGSPNQRYSGIQFTPGAPTIVNAGDRLSAWMFKISEVLGGPGTTTNINRIRINFTDLSYASTDILSDVGIWNQLTLIVTIVDDGKTISNLQVYGISNSKSTAKWYIDDIILITSSAATMDLSLSSVALSQSQPAQPSIVENVWSDRAAWDVLAYQSRHTNDIDNGIHWTATGIRNIAGNMGWFNVKDYGALGDGITDDTVAIQDTIDAAETVGGGVVYFPRGIYIVGGALQDVARSNAQLLLPLIDCAIDSCMPISFIGEVTPVQLWDLSTISVPITSGVIIKGTLNAGAGGSLLGGWGPAGTYQNFTFIHVHIENIAFQMPANPVLSAVNLDHVMTCDIYNVTIRPDTIVIHDMTEPTTATSFALKTPQVNNAAYTRLDGVTVMGFYNGINVNEHTVGMAVNVGGCKNALVFPANYQTSWFNRICVAWCVNGVVFTGAEHHTFVGTLMIEHYNPAIDGNKWYDPGNDIDDAGDDGFGSIIYHCVLAITGAEDPIVVNGAANLNIYELDDGFGADTVKVSANDTTSGYLNGKLIAGSNITLTENNNGANETLTIEAHAPGGSDPVFHVEGALMVAADVDGVHISPRVATITAVYIYCRDPGSASSTIVDVHKNGVTIFTNQANRPTLAWNDGDQVAKSGVPDIVTLAENDVLSIDIDQIGTGSEDLTVIVAISSLISGQGARVYRDNVQTIPTGAWTPVEFDHETYDTDSIHDNVVNNSRLTCKTAGKYIITGSVTWDGHIGHQRGVSIYLNNATFLAISFSDASTVGYWAGCVSAIYDLAVNEYVELTVTQSTGGNLNLAVDVMDFSMQRIG
jgi:hypothetical protein